MRTIEGKPGQSIFDLALEAYGAVEGIDFIFGDNPSIVETADPYEKELTIRDQYLDKTNVEQIFSKRIPTSE